MHAGLAAVRVQLEPGSPRQREAQPLVRERHREDRVAHEGDPRDEEHERQQLAQRRGARRVAVPDGRGELREEEHRAQVRPLLLVHDLPPGDSTFAQLRVERGGQGTLLQYVAFLHHTAFRSARN